MKRTRHVNNDPRVIEARDAVDAALANTYAEPARVRRALERRLVEKGENAATIAQNLYRNPRAFGADWFGLGDVNNHLDRPKPERLADALNNLTGVLVMIRIEAANKFPVSGGRK